MGIGREEEVKERFGEKKQRFGAEKREVGGAGINGRGWSQWAGFVSMGTG